MNYKTTLCDKWETYGSCPYKSWCKFAHGKLELRHPSENIEQKQEQDKDQKPKRHRYRQRWFRHLPEHVLKSPLNPKAKEFEFKTPPVSPIASQMPNQMTNQMTNQIPENKEYDMYWNIIHKLVLDESV